ncbi:MAG: SIR2 family protein [Verrucomicrobiia bacterium]
MKLEYIKFFPKPLLDDLVADAWLPVIGAGLSRNALVPSRKKMPLWDDLGRQLAEELADYPYAGSLDAISAYEHEYGRTKLIERLGEILLVHNARPSSVHRAFCEIPFRIVCTTNFDFLLERQYEQTPNYCRPVIDEQQLSINSRDPGVTLLKLHGDLHHPERLVITESDYDGFLHKYPLLATYLANLLISRTAVLIGYSLDDPDFRQIWNVVTERLGKTRRVAYALLVDAKPTEVSRYERRGVKVISLPGDRAKYGEILEAAFREIKGYLQSQILPASHVTEEAPLKELALPRDAVTRLCFFAMPLSIQPFYKERVFPIVREAGFVPVLATDVISPGENYVAKISALIDRSTAVVVDESSPFTMAEFRLAFQEKARRVLAIFPEGAPVTADLAEVKVVRRPRDLSGDLEHFLKDVSQWFHSESINLKPKLAEEPLRLLNAGEFRAAVISAVTLLETKLQDTIQQPTETRTRPRLLRELIDVAISQEKISSSRRDQLFEWIRLRNQVVHSDTHITKLQAKNVVNGVAKITKNLN